MANTIQTLSEKGQSVWCDNLSREMIDSGELARLIELGVTGVTSNPTIFMKAISGSSAYDETLSELIGLGADLPALYEGLVLPDIADAADLLLPIYERTNGVDGYVSLEVSPRLAYDTEGTIEEARRLFTALDRPNVYIKVPATDEGIPAIETLIAEGINVNVTLIFSLAVYERVMRAYIEGLRLLGIRGGGLMRVNSVASFFVSRVDTLVDALLEKKVPDPEKRKTLQGRAAVANAKLAYARFREVFNPDSGPFCELDALGAHPQRPLWASTSTKNPDYRDTLYVDELVAPNSVNTMPPATLEATLDHGETEVRIFDGVEEAGRLLEDLRNVGINIDDVTEELRTQGVRLFEESFEELMANLTRKQASLHAM